MDQSISAADANRHFSEVLRAVRRGRSYVVTSHGKPVAKIIPVEMPDKVMMHARGALITRLRSQRATDIGRWTRDELYEHKK